MCLGISRPSVLAHAGWADAIELERQVNMSAKRARLREEQEGVIQLTNAKRLLATAQREAEETKRNALLEASFALQARKEQEIANAAAKKYSAWLQTVFPAQHAAGMTAHIQTMSDEAIRHTLETMTTLERQRVFHRWISLDDPWQPDLSLLHNFGSLPDMDGAFMSTSRRQVKCSPQLAAFIVGHTTYVQPFAGPDPESAFRHLLRSCFVRDNCMFKDACSPYQLLCRSQMILRRHGLRQSRPDCLSMARPAGNAGRLH